LTDEQTTRAYAIADLVVTVDRQTERQADGRTTCDIITRAVAIVIVACSVDVGAVRDIAASSDAGLRGWCPVWRPVYRGEGRTDGLGAPLRTPGAAITTSTSRTRDPGQNAALLRHPYHDGRPA